MRLFVINPTMNRAPIMQPIHTPSFFVNHGLSQRSGYDATRHGRRHAGSRSSQLHNRVRRQVLLAADSTSVGKRVSLAALLENSSRAHAGANAHGDHAKAGRLATACHFVQQRGRAPRACHSASVSRHTTSMRTGTLTLTITPSLSLSNASVINQAVLAVRVGMCARCRQTACSSNPGLCPLVQPLRSSTRAWSNRCTQHVITAVHNECWMQALGLSKYVALPHGLINTTRVETAYRAWTRYSHRQFAKAASDNRQR